MFCFIAKFEANAANNHAFWRIHMSRHTRAITDFYLRQSGNWRDLLKSGRFRLTGAHRGSLSSK